jgi:quercetin dioxygenase-like cupin family protein
MPYDQNDPRSKLSTAGGAPSGIPRPATYRQLHHSPADEQHQKGSLTWWTRSQAMVIAHTEAQANDMLAITTAGEHALLVLDGAQVRVEAEAGSETVDEDSVVIVPPGSSTVHVNAAGNIVRIFAAEVEPDLAARCVNHADYEPADENVAEYVAWPAPTEGERVRVYPLADHPGEVGRLGRIFRCSTVMVNLFEPVDDPRDPTKMSPHHHDDFEQVSLQMDGDYVHHMRVPWTPDMTTWRDDEHEKCEGPSVLVIPPPIIHTSQAVGEMRHFLIDVFAPPRMDFSERPGWVLNADDYPMP